MGWVRVTAPKKYVVDVIGECFLGQIGHLLGHKLTAYLYGLAGHGVFHDVELVALLLEVESLDRKQLVGVKHRKLFLVVHVSAGKVDGREVGCKSLLFLITCRAQFLSPAAEVFVVAESEVATLGEGECRPFGHYRSRLL